MDKNEEGQLEDKSGGGARVDVFGKTGGQLAERGFDAFAIRLN